MTQTELGSQPPDPQRVLLVHNRYQQGGGEDTVFEEEGALLERHGHRVERLVVDNDAIETERGLRGQLQLAIGTVWSRDAVRLVTDRLVAMRANVMHVHNTLPLLSPAVHVAARRLGIASVQTLHNYRLSCPAATFFRDGAPCEDCRGKTVTWPAVLHSCYRGSATASAAVTAMLAVHRVRRTWTRDVTAFIALTAFAKDRLLSAGLPPGRVVVKPNFLGFDPGPPETDGEGYLYVGRLSPEKGIDTLLEGWRELASAVTLPFTATLRIGGVGPLEGQVHEAAAAVPSIVPLGRLDQGQVIEELQAARALIVPSLWYEGCPLVVIEAFAAGRPVIASSLGSLKEMVTDRVTGLLIDPGDKHALANAVRWAEEHPTEMIRMGEAARAEYLNRYTADVNYRQLAAIYTAASARMKRSLDTAGS